MANKIDDYLKTLMKGGDVPPDVENALVTKLAATDPAMLAGLAQTAFNRARAAEQGKEELGEAMEGLKNEIEGLKKPPFEPADVLHVYPDGRIDVISGQRRQIVLAMDDLDLEALEPGDEVWLNPQINMVVAKSPSALPGGSVASVVDTQNGRLVVRGIADEESVAVCAPRMLAELTAGDRVIVRRESNVVVARLPHAESSPYELQELPPYTFDDIGGLDDVVGKIRSQVRLYLHHGEIADLFAVPGKAGMMLVGPPGGGKTMLAGAIAHELAAADSQTKFLSIKPGALRNSLYGRSEELIRELFAYARRQSGVTVIFFDEIENLGVRGESVGHTIDDRVMTAFLAELSGLERSDNLFVVAATNRLDLCDEALSRGDRFGDGIYTIPRPDRYGTTQILDKHLLPVVPYGIEGGVCGEEARGRILDAAVSYLFSENGHGALANVVFASSDRYEVAPRDVLSGALLASAVVQARRSAAERRIGGDELTGVTEEDLLCALDSAIAAEVVKLRKPQAARRILDVADGEQIVRVEINERPRPAAHRFMQAA